MTQYARPISDIATGNWTDEGTVDNDGSLYTSIDEVTSDDDDSYINGDNTATVFCVKLDAVNEPSDPTQCNLHLLMRSSGNGGPEKLDVILYEDYEGTPIARATWNNQSNRSGTYSDVTAGTLDLSAVIDWSNLYVEGTADSIGSGEWLRVTQIYLETPDAEVGALTVNVNDSIGLSQAID
jgi:hypothetical protein